MQINKIKITLILIIAITTGYLSFFTNKNSLNKTIPSIDENELYKVIKVLDGDTFNIKINSKTVTIRMLGIDTPETVDPRKTVQCFGKQASDMTKELLLKNSVKLMLDSSQNKTDKYNRVLAYVYRDDGLFINKYLLENGYAHEYTFNIPYLKKTEFKELENGAKNDRKGLWGKICDKL